MAAPGPGRRAGRRGGPGRLGPGAQLAFAMVLVERLAEAERAYASCGRPLTRRACRRPSPRWPTATSYLLARMGRLDEALESVSTRCRWPTWPRWSARSPRKAVPTSSCTAATWTTAPTRASGPRPPPPPAGRHPLLFAYDVRGHRGAGRRGRRRLRAVRPAGATVHRLGIGEPCLPPWPRHAISAYLAAGRTADAERVLAWVEYAAGRLPCRFPRIAAATGHAQLAEQRGDHAAAVEHYQAALVLHDEIGLPVEHAEHCSPTGPFCAGPGTRPPPGPCSPTPPRSPTPPQPGGWRATRARN